MWKVGPPGIYALVVGFVLKRDGPQWDARAGILRGGIIGDCGRTGCAEMAEARSRPLRNMTGWWTCSSYRCSSR